MTTAATRLTLTELGEDGTTADGRAESATAAKKFPKTYGDAIDVGPDETSDVLALMARATDRRQYVDALPPEVTRDILSRVNAYAQHVDDAADVLPRVLVAWWRLWRTYDSRPAEVGGYVSKFLANVATDRHRRDARTVSLDALAQSLTPESRSAEREFWQEHRARARAYARAMSAVPAEDRRLLARLVADQQEALVRRRARGVDVVARADAMSVPVHVAYAHIRREIVRDVRHDLVKGRNDPVRRLSVAAVARALEVKGPSGRKAAEQRARLMRQACRAWGHFLAAVDGGAPGEIASRTYARLEQPTPSARGQIVWQEWATVLADELPASAYARVPILPDQSARGALRGLPTGQTAPKMRSRKGRVRPGVSARYLALGRDAETVTGAGARAGSSDYRAPRWIDPMVPVLAKLAERVPLVGAPCTNPTEGKRGALQCGCASKRGALILSVTGEPCHQSRARQ